MRYPTVGDDIRRLLLIAVSALVAVGVTVALVANSAPDRNGLTIEIPFSELPDGSAHANRLYGRVLTLAGDEFEGFLRWDQNEGSLPVRHRAGVQERDLRGRGRVGRGPGRSQCRHRRLSRRNDADRRGRDHGALVTVIAGNGRWPAVRERLADRGATRRKPVRQPALRARTPPRSLGGVFRGRAGLTSTKDHAEVPIHRGTDRRDPEGVRGRNSDT